MNKISLFAILLIIVRDGKAHDANSHDCQELENAVRKVCEETEYGSARIRGPPGKKGIQGERGAVGPVGPRGPEGVVDYERINQEVERKVSERVEAMIEQLRDITEKVEDLYSIVKPENCDVEYNGKCFYAVLHPTADVNFTQGKLLCERLGWGLANIYDLEHYQLIEEYLRSKIAAGKTYTDAWLGMTHVTKKEVTLSSGRQIDLRNLKWYPTYPKNYPSHKNMAIIFRSLARHDHQGIYNHFPSTNKLGAVCESN